MVTAALLSEERDERIAAVLRIDLDAHGVYALRGALVADEDAEVRSVCAERLGVLDVARLRGRIATAVRLALEDATRDASPMVREHAIASLARHFEHDEHDPLRASFTATLRELVAREPVWRVRRAAVRALASVDATAHDVLVDVLDDPFWRVRYAAIQAFVELPMIEPVIARAARTPRRDAALAYLRARWSGEMTAIAPDDATDAFETGALDDEDPAVVAVAVARATDDALDASKLAAFLRSPHEVLRRAAGARIVARGRIGELRAAVALLDEPRVPYADESARHALARADTRALREEILRTRASPAAIAWCIDECARRGDVAFDAATLVAHESVLVRRAAIDACDRETALDALSRALRDDDATVRATSATLLAHREDGDAVLDAHDFTHEAPRVVRAAMSGDRATARTVSAARASIDPAARAAAIAKLAASGALDDDARRAAQSDEDPWTRSAAMDAARAREALRDDPDPETRRAAFLVARLTDDVVTIAAHCDDAWLRTRAAEALRKSADVSIEIVLRLTRDRAPMVRSAAAEALAAREDAADACFAIVARDPPVDEALRLAAHARLVMEGSARAFDALEHDLETRELSSEARFALLGMSLAYPDDVRTASSLVYEPRPAARAIEPPKIAQGERRTLGATDVALSPLIVSGAFELHHAWLARARDAGVNAFFWEPEYRALGAFLARAERKEDLVVVAGTYEADRKTIERDAERALKRLRIDALGAMLLFWVRSPARLSDEAYEALSRLKERGKVRAIGFSTHLRDLAARAITERHWDVVMTRHSAAHTGAESALLPVARERNVGVIAFSALVYGRMLSNAVDAADCYRYSLAQPGVSAVITAPRRQRELEQNLAVMRRSSIDADAIIRLRDHGARVREENRAFMSLVRGRQ